MSNTDKYSLTTDLMCIFQNRAPCWCAELSDGTTVYQDDYRTDVIENAWVRLRRYCEDTGVNINKLYLRFMDNVQAHQPEKATGYFWRNAHFGLAGAGSWPAASLGYVEGNTVYSSKWQLPELLKYDSDVRELRDVPESVIMRRT